MEFAEFARGISVRRGAPLPVLSLADLLSFPRPAFASFYRSLLPADPNAGVEFEEVAGSAVKATLLDFASRTAPEGSSVLVVGAGSKAERAACLYCASSNAVPSTSTFAVSYFGYGDFARKSEVSLPPKGERLDKEVLREWSVVRTPIHCYAALFEDAQRALDVLGNLADLGRVPTISILAALSADRDAVVSRLEEAAIPARIEASVALPRGQGDVTADRRLFIVAGPVPPDPRS